MSFLNILNLKLYTFLIRHSFDRAICFILGYIIARVIDIDIRKIWRFDEVDGK